MGKPMVAHGCESLDMGLWERQELKIRAGVWLR